MEQLTHITLLSPETANHLQVQIIFMMIMIIMMIMRNTHITLLSPETANHLQVQIIILMIILIMITGVTTKHQKFIFGYCFFPRKSYLNMGHS